jgi:hypothetical protein
MKTPYIALALTAFLISSSACAGASSGNDRSSCQQRLDQASACEALAQRSVDPDRVEGAELQCDQAVRAEFAACGPAAPKHDAVADRVRPAPAP